jgi:tetratricopeptide (TPR) repeat protein
MNTLHLPKHLSNNFAAAIAISTLIFTNAFAAEDAGKSGATSASLSSGTASPAESAEHKKAIELNEKGQAAMRSKDYAEAVKDFRTALDLSAHFDEAKMNLVAAHNAYGASLSKEPKKAIVQYHRALSLDKTDATAKKGLDAAIKAMGMNPRSADNRLSLADQAQVDNDREGVGIEMDAADYLKSHPNQDVDYDSAKSKR